MAASNLCCTHPQQRTDSPEPPSRPLASLDGIFAAAALPEDHPHAFKFPDRKSELDPNIARSPNIASKLKLQFRRKSMKNLGKHKEFDEDAHRLSSREVLHDIERAPELDEPNNQITQIHRFSSVMDLSTDDPATRTAASSLGRTSVLRELEYLRPLFDRPSNLTVSGESYNMTDIANRVAARKHLADISKENEYPLQTLPKSLSSPTLVASEPSTAIRLRRSRSEYGLGEALIVPKSRSQGLSDEPSSHCNSKPLTVGSEDIEQPASLDVPILHVQEPTNISDDEPQKLNYEALNMAPDQGNEISAVESAIRLHTMDISQQLRCMSQLSDVVEDETPLAPSHPWNHHPRERLDLAARSGRSRHSRQISSSGMDSTTVPSAWGRVRSPMRDAASSEYSRPTSAGANGVDPDVIEAETLRGSPTNDLDALFADWPLKPSPSAEQTQQALRVVSKGSARSECRDKPLPPTPGDSRKASTAASFVTATHKDEGSSVKWLSLPQRANSIQSKDSSSTLSKGSKQSRFFDKFSPPKKLVRKRRSIFKFLRPGSRKQQTRSISTPVLSVKSPKSLATYDGQSDDPALLTVQYELSENPSSTARSLSMSELAPGHHSEATNQLTAPQSLQRRPTLADYERNLSAAGDDRRRPSTVNVHKVNELHKDDRQESLSIRRKLSRAHALKDDASPLMAQALEKHQQEKALFRSASKQRESHKSSRTTASVRGYEDLPRTSSEGHSTLEAVLEKGALASPSARSSSVTHLAPPEPPVAGSSRRGSIATTSRAPSTKFTGTEETFPSSVAQNHRIGTSLGSWSRYPSHTRSERCSTAGPSDAVLTRDFAIYINPNDIKSTDDTEAALPENKRTAKSTTKHSKKLLTKSRSMTFSGIVRYYSNLFHTSGFSGQNRRTSITTGGRLEYPELEILPPQMPAEPPSQHRQSHTEQLTQLKKHMKEDADKIREYVKDEEDKFEGYVKQEEDKFEHFVKEEEEMIEGFVKKEELKLKGYVKQEEDKLLHHHRQQSSGQDSASRSSPFREISVFTVPLDHDHDHDHKNEHFTRRDTMIGPTDDVNDRVSKVHADKSVDGRLLLDGAAESRPEQEQTTPSKAEIFSNSYRECLARSISTDNLADSNTGVQRSGNAESTTVMPPPNLKPIKSRSPEHVKQLEAKATIRRFPSVTVIDDRKGHLRSVSFISVKTSRSTGFDRSSTHDLLDVVQAQEQKARETVLRGSDVPPMPT